MRRLVTWFATAISLFASCADNRATSVADIVSQWEGREILFPENSVFTIQGRDTVDFQFKDAPYKILTYVDSVGCMSCKLQLMNWSKLIAEVDSMTDSSIPVVFYINAPSKKELNYITRRDGFMHPVCYDEQDEINKLNHFPQDMTFQTFLLDADNKVVVIGNPVHNYRVKELYLNIIQDKVKVDIEDLPAITLESTEIDFGRFRMNQIQTHTIKIINTGKGALVIQGITTSCGCTEVEYSKEPISSGQFSELTVHYTPDETGFFNKTISVYTNAAEAPVIIRVKGMVE